MFSRLLILLLLQASLAPAWDSYPALKGKTLDGKDFDLRAHDGKTALVLVLGFSKASEARTRAWQQALGEDFGADPRVAVYGVAMLEKAPGFIRPMILRSMKKKLPPERQASMIIVTENSQAWLDRFAAPLKADPDRAFVVTAPAPGLPDCASDQDAGLEERKRFKECMQMRLKHAR